MVNLFRKLKLGNRTTLFMFIMFIVYVISDVLFHFLNDDFSLKRLLAKIFLTFFAAAAICVIYNFLSKRRNYTTAKVDKSVLGLILDNLDTCIYMTETDTGKIIFMNKKMRKEFGGKNFIGKICWEVLQDGFTERCKFCSVPKLKKDPKKPCVWEEHNTVTKKYYQNTDTLLEWIDGSTVHMQHSVDITERKLSEIKITDMLNKLESVMMSYPGIIMSFDENGNHSFSSGHNIEKFNAIKEYFAGNNYKDPNFNFDEYSKKIKMAYSGACSHWTLDIGEESYNCFLSSIMNNADKIIGVLFTATDISAMTKMQKELQKAIELAEKASKAKGDFLSRMSHEMRTPMNAIMGMSQIAQMSDSEEKINYCLKTIDNSSKHLLGLINDILDMSKIEANKLVLEKEPFNIEKMVMNVCNIILDKAEEKNQTLDVILGQNLYPNVMGDELRLSQVLTNLLINAIKFTPKKGKITLLAEQVKTSEKQNIVRFSVSDNGIGISPEQQERLFRSFEQADGSIARKYGGTGLGLSICKSIIEKMGGKISVESRENEGSKFYFEIQFDIAPVSDTKTLVGEIKPSDLKILAVDDSDDIRKYFQEIMHKFGIPTDVAASGQEAVDFVKKASETDGKPYDVIFLDWCMPEMDGIETAKQINDVIDKNTAIIMISASEWANIENLAKNVGINKFVPKPLFPSAILNSINEVVGQTMQKIDIKVAKNKKNSDFSHVSLLLVEDVEINRYIFKSFLEETNAKIDIAENGLEAVKKFKESPDKYNVIIMDIQMPEMNGHEATKAIRALDIKNAKTIPIVAMTANAFKEDIDMCMESGMNDHLAKPVEKEKVIEKISLYAEKPAPNSTNVTDFLPYIDVEDMKRRLGDGISIYPELLNNFMQNNMIADFKQEFAAGNIEAARKIVHTIKGIVSNLSLNEAYRETQNFEAKLKENAQTQSDADKFEQVLNTTIQYVEKFIEICEKVC